MRPILSRLLVAAAFALPLTGTPFEQATADPGALRVARAGLRQWRVPALRSP